MKKIIKLLVATSLIFATTTVSAFAQSYSATAWTIRDDVDYALDSRYYKDANINDFLVYTSLDTRKFNIDFAKQFEKLYFGLNLNSNFLGYQDFANKESPTTTTKSIFGISGNSLEMLFGFNNMGITFYTNVTTMTDQTKEDSTITGKGDNTNIELQASWGSSFKHDKFTYKPELVVYTNFDINNGIITTNPSVTTYDKEFDFEMNLNNDFVFGNKSGLYSILGVDYTWGIPDTRTYDKSNVFLGKTSSFNNNLFLSYLMNYKASEKVILGAEFDLAQNFNFAKGSDKLGNVTSSQFYYSLIPTLFFGMKYSAIPSKFVIDGGFYLYLPYLETATTENKITNTKTTTSVWSQDTPYTDSTTLDSFIPTLRLGFEWTPFTNFVIDTGFSYSIGNNFDSLFNSISIGISYRK